MKIRVKKTVCEIVDIGELDSTTTVSNVARKRRGMKSLLCSVCGKKIEDDAFVVGFKKGCVNMMFHKDCL